VVVGGRKKKRSGENKMGAIGREEDRQKEKNE
jgi:hypothetical protein